MARKRRRGGKPKKFCRQCGRRYRDLEAHLASAHQITECAEAQPPVACRFEAEAQEELDRLIQSKAKELAHTIASSPVYASRLGSLSHEKLSQHVNELLSTTLGTLVPATPWLYKQILSHLYEGVEEQLHGFGSGDDFKKSLDKFRFSQALFSKNEIHHNFPLI